MIPKHIHLIWIWPGNETLHSDMIASSHSKDPYKLVDCSYILHHTREEYIPNKYLSNLKKMYELHTEFEFTIWNNEQVLKLIEDKYTHLLNLYLYPKLNITRCDIARMCILHTHGGVYMDLDFHVKKNITPLMKHKLLLTSECSSKPHEEFVKTGDTDVKKIFNGFLGSEPGSEFIGGWIEQMKINIETIKENTTGRVKPTWWVLRTTGPIGFYEYWKSLSIDMRPKVEESFVNHCHSMYSYFSQKPLICPSCINFDEEEVYLTNNWIEGSGWNSDVFGGSTPGTGLNANKFYKNITIALVVLFLACVIFHLLKVYVLS